MGKKFVGTCGGRGALYGCRLCHTYITCQFELTSTAFTGSTGPATLFRRVWNVEHGETSERKMTTGWHIVRDVICLICKTKLGWMYEMALKDDQVYKEGQVILENAYIMKISDALRDPLGEDLVEGAPSPNIEMTRYRTPSENSRNSSNSESGSSSASSDSWKGY